MDRKTLLPLPARTRSILVEGWRGINHSYALVAQHQMLGMMRMPDVRLYYRDLPYFLPHWNAKDHDPGFSAEDGAALASLREPDGAAAIDAVYRVAYPFRTGPAGESATSRRCRTVTFMITEMGLSPGDFPEAGVDAGSFTRDGDVVVTSSHWSRDRIVDYGFEADSVHVVPLGVDQAIFSPMQPGERAHRRAVLGFADGETVFLNVGAPLWNKGADLLLRAFAILRLRGLPVRLMIKDQQALYGMSFQQLLHSLAAGHPEVLSSAVTAGITLIPGNLTPPQLRTLFAVADCYVSPYRSEGFNLPVLEAIACGTPTIVTDGGATADFCRAETSVLVPGTFRRHTDDAGRIGAYIEPNFDDLVDAMATLALGWRLDRPAFDEARQAIGAQCSWQRSAELTTALLVGDGGSALSPDPVRPTESSATLRPPVGQSDVLGVLRMLQPRVITEGGKVRIGAAHDGGYVLPAAALACDAVLSIGVGADASFDHDLACRGLPVLQYDHTVEGPPLQHARFQFQRSGWGAVTAGNFVSLADMKDSVRRLNASRPLLKFNVDGAEYEILSRLDDDALRDFPVIACELHDLARLGDRSFYDLVHRCLRVLTRHHLPVHLHANNHGAIAIVAGVPVPDVVEISFMRRDLGVADEPAADPIPGNLDRPNHPLRADICLTPFLVSA